MQETFDKKDFDRENLKKERKTTEPMPERSVERVEVLEKMKDAANLLMDKEEARLVCDTRETLARIMGTVDTNHNMLFVGKEFKRAAREIMTNIQEDGGVREALESDIILVATYGLIVQAIANITVKDKKPMTPVVKFVAKEAKKGINEAAQQSVLAVPQSTSSTPGG